MGAGGSKVDLGNYAMKSYVQDQLNNYSKKEALDDALVAYLKREDVQAQLKSFIESQGSTGPLDQKIASFLYVKQADLQKYLERQDFDKEMLNYLKKIDLNAELQKYVLDANLEKRVAELGFTKQTQIEVPANRLDELAARITTLQGPRNTLVNAIAANQEGLPNAVAEKISTDDTALTRISTKLGTTYKDQLAQSIAVNSTTLPDTVAEQIVTNDARAGILAGKLITQQQNALVAQIKEKMIVENIDALRGPPGDLGNPQTVEINLKPRTMWCATGEYCEVPTAKKGLILGANQDIVGDGDAAKTERMVRVRDHLAFQSNTGIDFANEVEAQAHDTPANQIKIHTRSMKDGVKDGTIRSRFDKTNDTEANAKNSALEIYGIGKSYGALRHPRQVKVFDNLDVSENVSTKVLKVDKLQIGDWTLQQHPNSNLHIYKGNDINDWKYALDNDGTLHTSRGVRIDKTADWRLSSNGGNNNLHVHKGPDYGNWHASFETNKTVTGHWVKALGDLRADANISAGGNINVNEVNANRVNLGEFSMLYSNPWFFIGRKDNPQDNWRAVVHQDIGDDTVKSRGGYRADGNINAYGYIKANGNLHTNNHIIMGDDNAAKQYLLHASGNRVLDIVNRKDDNSDWAWDRKVRLEADGIITTSNNVHVGRELVVNNSVPKNRWLFHVPADGRKEMHIARRRDDNSDWGWVDGDHTTIYDGSVHNKNFNAREALHSDSRVSIRRWKLKTMDNNSLHFYSGDNDGAWKAAVTDNGVHGQNVYAENLWGGKNVGDEINWLHRNKRNT